MTNQASLEQDERACVEEFGEQLAQADRQCRRETGHALSPSWKSLCFTMFLKERRGVKVDWTAMRVA